MSRYLKRRVILGVIMGVLPRILNSFVPVRGFLGFGWDSDKSHWNSLYCNKNI
jgi:hypothetical protein